MDNPFKRDMDRIKGAVLRNQQGNTEEEWPGYPRSRLEVHLFRDVVWVNGFLPGHGDRNRMGYIYSVYDEGVCEEYDRGHISFHTKDELINFLKKQAKCHRELARHYSDAIKESDNW